MRICSVGLFLLKDIDFLYFQSIFPFLFYFSSQWEKLQKDDTDPGQLKGIKYNTENYQGNCLNYYKIVVSDKESSVSKWSLKRVYF